MQQETILEIFIADFFIDVGISWLFYQSAFILCFSLQVYNVLFAAIAVLSPSMAG